MSLDFIPNYCLQNKTSRLHGKSGQNPCYTASVTEKYHCKNTPFIVYILTLFQIIDLNGTYHISGELAHSCSLIRAFI